jgi:hypothetical protein
LELALKPTRWGGEQLQTAQDVLNISVKPPIFQKGKCPDYLVYKLSSKFYNAESVKLSETVMLVQLWKLVKSTTTAEINLL